MKIWRHRIFDWMLYPSRLFGVRGLACEWVPGVIIMHTSVDLATPRGQCLLAHELVHKRQMRRYTWLGYMVLYLWQWVCAAVHHGPYEAYWHMRLEAEAYDEQTACLAGYPQ